MLAFVCHFDGEEWFILIHGETRAKAKWNFIKWNPFSLDAWDSWNLVRTKRLSECDDKPFTWQNAKDAGFEYTTDEISDGTDDPEHFIPEEFFPNDCNCSICQPPLWKPQN